MWRVDLNSAYKVYCSPQSGSSLPIRRRYRCTQPAGHVVAMDIRSILSGESARSAESDFSPQSPTEGPKRDASSPLGRPLWRGLCGRPILQTVGGGAVVHLAPCWWRPASPPRQSALPQAVYKAEGQGVVFLHDELTFPALPLTSRCGVTPSLCPSGVSFNVAVRPLAPRHPDRRPRHTRCPPPQC